MNTPNYPIPLDLIDFPKLHRRTDAITGKRIYDTPVGSFPSVTTILSSTKDNSGLDKWRQAVGEEKAAAIVKKSTDLGSMMHLAVESWLLDVEQPAVNGSHPMRALARDMASVHIATHIIGKISKIIGIEAELHSSSGQYAGATDMIGYYDGVLSIIDHKSSRKIKKDEHVTDYKQQLAAYAIAYQDMFGESIDQGVILLTTHCCQSQSWIISGDEFKQAKADWIDRVCEYYSKQ